jgi:hypothetical protein
MIYPPTYFDNCNGLIPQIVLSSMLLQAGNERTRQYNNAFLKDISDAVNWFQNTSEGKTFLNISGYLPLVESRYLINTLNIVERISALNSFDASSLSDATGLPVDVFAHPALQSVTLPPDIPHLSIDELVVETRLAYLLLLLEKKNNLIAFYNCLNAIKIFATSRLWDVATLSYTTDCILNKVVEICFENLFQKYRRLKPKITGIESEANKLEFASDWLKLQMESSNPEHIPKIDLVDFVDGISEIINAFKSQVTFPVNTSIFVVGGNDVSSEISSGGNSIGDGAAGGDYLNAQFGSPDNDTSPLAPQSGSSPFNTDTPVNSLPEC